MLKNDNADDNDLRVLNENHVNVCINIKHTQ